MANRDPNICPRKKSCIYGGRMGGIDICNYLELTGEKRPCPPGVDCTEYKKGRQKRKPRTVLYDL